MLQNAATSNQPEQQKQAGNLKIHHIENKKACASISGQGAQLLGWTPKGQENVIWLSPNASYAKGTPVRGGIPVCWPWFGPHPTTSEYPSHGFARRKEWKLKTNEDQGDKTLLEFELINDEFESWPYHCSATLKLIIGESLNIQMTTKNLSLTNQLSYTQALHTYFRIGDIKDVTVLGLENTQYIDKVNSGALGQDEKPLNISSEIDRIYSAKAEKIIIDDKSMRRKITISHQGANAIVVWNPGEKKANELGDMGPAGSHKQMLCIETATAGRKCMILNPGEQHTISSTYDVTG